jgi:hypothetical protein
MKPLPCKKDCEAASGVTGETRLVFSPSPRHNAAALQAARPRAFPLLPPLPQQQVRGVPIREDFQVAHRFARLFLFALLTLLSFGLVGGPTPGEPAFLTPPLHTATDRDVFLCGGLGQEELLTLTCAVAAAEHPGVVLLDSPKSAPYNKAFLAAFHPERVIPVGTFPDGLADLEHRLNVKTMAPVVWEHGQALDLWKILLQRGEQVVVCPPEPRGQLLQAACLAGTLRAPLYVLHDGPEATEDLRRWLREWRPRSVSAVGTAAAACRELRHGQTINLTGETEVATAHLRQLLRQGPVETLVVANPADLKDNLGDMSTLAPWVAVQRHAALVLTNDSGVNVEEVVRAALRVPHLEAVENLLLVAGLRAIPMPTRPNPIPGDKDLVIEMEPFTPAGSEPFTFAIGRLFHDEPGAVPLMLARQRLLREARPPRRALVMSNPGGSLALLEAFSRNTAFELRNAGYQTTARFGNQITADDVRHLMQENDVFLWEGHHNTLVRDWGFPSWDEPLPASFVFLQSCLALHDWKAGPLLHRGAVAVVGSSTRIYSASGGACSLAFFDALLYEDRSLGASLRQAKNFLVAYAELKDKRLGKDARRSAANLRSAWAFTLWGDPTLHLPRPDPPANALAPVRHEVHGNTIVVSLPPTAHDKVITAKYQVQMLPNARLAGLVQKDRDDEGQPLVPFVFAEVRLPHAPAGQVPQLHGALPANHWVFTWDARRKTGFLLALLRPKDREELRFHVEWTPSDNSPVAEGK